MEVDAHIEKLRSERSHAQFAQTMPLPMQVGVNEISDIKVSSTGKLSFSAQSDKHDFNIGLFKRSGCEMRYGKPAWGEYELVDQDRMIERTIQRVMESTAPSSGDDLLGFEIDADHFFGENEALVNATVSRTEDLSCMLELRGEVADHISSLQQLSGVLNEIWQSLAYSHYESSSCEWYQEAMVFRFVTVISGDDFYVSGRMIVGGENYSRLVNRFENDFGQRLTQLSTAV